MRFILLALQLLLAVPRAFAVPLSSGGKKNGFDHLVVFGDSFSDSGHGAWVVSNHTWPPKVYPGHRFSNGKVWAEGLAHFLSSTLRDYAIGGATTNNTLVQGSTGPQSSIPSPSLLDQIEFFVRMHGSTRPDLRRTLFVVHAGGNNAFFGLEDPVVTVDATVEDLKTAVKMLKVCTANSNRGLHFLLATLPPFGGPYPYTTLFPSTAPALTKFSSDYQTTVLEYASTDKSVVVADFHKLFKVIFAEPEKFGFNGRLLDQNCLRGIYVEIPEGMTICKQPREYVWWDEYHPTKATHHLLAVDAFDALKERGWC